MDTLIAALWGITGLAIGYVAGVIYAMLSRDDSCLSCDLENGDSHG
ncbi:hypothetical protein NJI34_20980 [Pseudomonas sp. S 311-6]|nr:hypothetical protein [Pseudomonas sp. S 311-6]